MATACIPQMAFTFQEFRQPVVARFDTPHGSSDGGAVLLKAIDEQLGLSARLAACLVDRRQPGKIQHSIEELLRQRLFPLACGYPDANDSARLAHDPVHKLLLDRDPLDGAALATQPTLSRFENAIDSKSLFRMAEAIADIVIETQRERRRGRAHRITIDLDPTEDATHGQQELTFFNGHYDTWCYLPLTGTIVFDDEPDHYPVCAILRPGNAPATRGAIGVMKRLITRLRAAFPHATLRVRLDGGFASPEVFSFLERARVEYLVAMGKNSVLTKQAEPLMYKVRARSAKTGKTEHRFGATRYRAKTWPKKRRVIVKAEVVRLGTAEPRDNPRFVVTNLSLPPEAVYEIYRGRGDCENRIKELKNGLALDRTSCTRFWANQFRVLLSLSAYVLYVDLRDRARHTGCARAQVSTLRERLVKLGAWVDRSVRRIVLHLPASYPWLNDWRAIARSVGALVT